MGLGYLICRILDTVEDAPWSNSMDQRTAFEQFEIFLTSPVQDAAAVRAWAAKFPKVIAVGERLLLSDAGLVFGEFAELSVRERTAMLSPILSMSRGMAAYAARERVLRLRDLVDVNVYCFFVAGVVGELLTGLVEDEMRPIGLDLATHFGLFLQKMNVLKDQRSDEAEGRFLVPDREQLFSSLQENAQGAIAYLQAIPVARRDYRLFCAWALYLGLATIPLLRQGATKLSRLQAMSVVARIEFAISDNDRLQEYFMELAAASWPSANDFVMTGSIDDARVALDASYSGRFDIRQLASLLAGKVSTSGRSSSMCAPQES